jgi:hypothetical protein
MCDRLLATAIVLFDQCPHGRTGIVLRVPADCRLEMSYYYHANAGGRLGALAKRGRADVVIDDLGGRGPRWSQLRRASRKSARDADPEGHALQRSPLMPTS